MWRSSVASKRHTPTPKPDVQESHVVSTSSRTPALFSQSTLAEALRSNPFRTKEAVSTSIGQDEDPVISLNNDLRLFANIYPDVKIEVLRELLTRFDGESRLHICTEQLFRYKSEWARGRLLHPPRDLDDEILADELFRHQEYITECRQTLYTEFKALNKSAIDAVLAEVNCSYSKARPILQEVVAKSWRATLTSLFRKKRLNEEPPSFLVKRGRFEVVLNPTGNAELNTELNALYFTATRQKRTQSQIQSDLDLANTLNQQEAEAANALFECQCCYNDVAFERITTCTADGHVICHDCVYRSLSEALFGQAWNKSVDTTIGSLRCLFPSQTDECTGHISPPQLHAAVLNSHAGHETWRKFEQRLAIDNLNRSDLALTYCPFCHYAEANHAITLHTATKIEWRFRIRFPAPTLDFVLLILLLEFLLPALLIFIVLLFVVSPSLPKQYFYRSLIPLSATRRTKIFRCRNASCSRSSCLSCRKPWHDPHTCHEPLILSLRTTVESARTAALKRTCPRCGTSFVKSSGCNKLVCVCGYAMCYLCRKNIGKTTSAEVENNALPFPLIGPGAAGAGAGAGARARARREEDNAIRAAGEGYRHFCEHFRPLPGMKCTECDKCDLYKTENEDEIVRRAGEDAERLWREQHKEELGHGAGGGSSSSSEGVATNENVTQDGTGAQGIQTTEVQGLDEALQQFGHRNRHGYPKNWFSMLWYNIRQGQWSIQGIVDRVVERCVVIVDDP